MTPLCLFVASGVLERHPKLKFMLVECDISWLAWVLQTLDQINDKRHMWIQPRLELKPNKYFKRQGTATFADDEVGLANRNMIGVKCLLWGNHRMTKVRFRTHARSSSACSAMSGRRSVK